MCAPGKDESVFSGIFIDQSQWWVGAGDAFLMSSSPVFSVSWYKRNLSSSVFMRLRHSGKGGRGGEPLGCCVANGIQEHAPEECVHSLPLETHLRKVTYLPVVYRF